MPWLRLDFHEGFVAPFFEINPNVSIISLEQEQLGSPISMNIILPAGEYAKNGILHLVWGSFFERELINHGVEKANIVITGNSRLDYAQKPSKTREELSKEFGLSLDKQWVLFAENRVFSLSASEEDISEYEQSGLSREAITSQFDYNAESLYEFERQINKLDDSFFDVYEFIYRSHPGQDLAIALPSQVKTISEYPISDWLGNIDLFVTFNSTSVFEAEIAGVPSLVHIPILRRAEHTVCGLDRFRMISELSDLQEANIEASVFSEKDTHRYEDFYGVIDGRSCERVAKAIIAECKNSTTRRLKPQGDAAFSRNKRLYELVTRISVGFGLLEIVKFPRSAYAERADIPYRKANRK